MDRKGRISLYTILSILVLIIAGFFFYLGNTYGSTSVTGNVIDGRLSQGGLFKKMKILILMTKQ